MINGIVGNVVIVGRVGTLVIVRQSPPVLWLSNNAKNAKNANDKSARFLFFNAPPASFRARNPYETATNAPAHDSYSCYGRKGGMLMNDGDGKNSIKNNQRALKHGGEGAIKRISEGKPFLGLAAKEEFAVASELALTGIPEMVKRDAIKLQTACNLYWQAVQKAAQDGDLVALDRYVARFGWLSGVTLRAWAQVDQDERRAGKGGVNVVDVLASLKGGDDGQANE